MKTERLNGFSLIELVIAVAILIFLAAGLAFGFSRLRDTTELDRSSSATEQFLRLAHERTLASSENVQWGVHVEVDQLELFSGSSYATGIIDDQYVFPQSVTAFPNLVGGGVDVLFARIDGTTAESGTVTLTAGGSGAQRIVTIFPSGETAISGSPPAQTGTRVTDTRHAHLLLPFSFDSSNTLRLTFSDPPNPDTVQTIDIPSNISNGQFLWSGSVTVGGSRQVLRFVTHAIGVTDTTLSVRRDRTENDKALQLDVDGAVIATYDVLGTLTPGVGVTATPQ